MLLIDDVNREIDRLEGDLKKLFPDAPNRVASYLAATRPNHHGSPGQPEPTPAPSPATK